MDPGHCDMWGPTQVAESALDAMASAAGVPATACEIHTMRIGGSFGRRLQNDYVRMATLIAKQVPGTPVTMMWTREEDMVQGRFHPVTQAHFRGALDAQGNLTACTCGFPASRSNRKAVRRWRKTAIRWCSRDCCPAGAGAFWLCDPQSSYRPCDAQPACPAGRVARGEPQ